MESEEEKMKLTTLGFYGGYPHNGIGTSAYLLESEGFHMLLDVGSGSLLALEKHVSPADLDAVLLSHYHHDHIADLGVLQFYRLLNKDKDGMALPLLPIYGHDDDQAHFEELTMDGVSEGHAYNQHTSTTIGPFTVTQIKTKHPVPCYALRIEETSTGKVVVFTADSGYIEEFISFSKGADVLLADSNFYRGKENHSVHMTAGECGKLAREAGAKQLILTHLPQTGDWQDLLEQATEQADDTKVTLAEKDLTITV